MRPSVALSMFFLAPCLAAVQTGGGFGAAVAAADVNGDDFVDVVVGEPHYTGGGLEEGRVLVYLGSPTGPASTPAWTREGLQPRAHLGARVAAVGDLNGDGFDDVAMTAPDFDVGWGRVRKENGAVYLRDAGLLVVYLGSPSGLGATPALFRPGIQADEHLGTALSTAGDVNGDGFGDLVVGATGMNGGRGIVLFFRGTPSGVEALPSWTRLGSLPNRGWGSALGGGGDMNADGYDDVLVGVPDGGPDATGTVHWFAGSALGFGPDPDASWTPGAISVDFGAALVIVGDLTGDGIDDARIGDPGRRYPPFLAAAGALALYRGSAAGPVPDEDIWLTRFSYADGLGRSLTAASDLDGDGSIECTGGGPDSSGMTYTAFHVDDPDLCQFLCTQVIREISPGSAGFGAALAAGDLDGDGFDDLIAGEPRFDGTTLDEGRVTVLRGNANFFDDPAPLRWTLAAP